MRSKVSRIAKQRGIAYLFKAGYRRLRFRSSIWLGYNYFRLFKRGSFTFQSKEYSYFYEKYNVTWRNERCIEVPIVWEYVRDFEGEVLEVGNVLSHYFFCKHDVVDKYEKAPHVINQDAADLKLPKKYDLIVSISTLEHVGWDEEPRDYGKIVRTVEKLRSQLNARGRFVATVPIGYNPYLDALLKANEVGFDKILCLKRVSKDNRWVETVWKDIENMKFGSPYPFANGLVVGIVEKH